ncbi:MAG TPA: hypothetical protein DEA55_06120 [Rhodospirillaceae bacterium]|nr:hypothetical protein [Rhodospirillaceae bacterium]
MSADRENSQERSPGIISRGKALLAKIKVGTLDYEDASYVERPALNAFVTGKEFVGEYWDQHIEDEDLATLWERCARVLKKYIPTIQEKEDRNKAQKTVDAIAKIAEIIRAYSVDKKPYFPIPTALLGILSESATPLRILGASVRDGKMKHWADPIGFEKLYYKAHLPYSITTGRRSGIDVPKEKFLETVEPFTKELGHSLSDSYKAAFIWQKLGRTIESAFNYCSLPNLDESVLLNDQVHVAALICDADHQEVKKFESGYASRELSDIRIPVPTMKRLSVTWREEVPTLVETLQKQNLNAFRSKNVQFLQDAAVSINRNFAPWFDQVGNNASADNTLDY